MKIMSLNVNNFGGLQSSKPRRDNFSSWIEYNTEMRIFQEDILRVRKAEAIIDTVEIEAPDVVVVQEFDVNAPAGQRAIELFIKYDYQPIYPDREVKISGNYSITMMFAKKQLQAIPCASPRIVINGGLKWSWRWCVVKIDDLTIIGVHAPLSGNVQKFFNTMQECAMKNKAAKMIMLGDMNVHSEKPCTYFTTFDTIRRTSEGGLGYFDAVKDGQVTYFRAGTTIDHVLISPVLKDNVTAEKVFDQKELELSDHAVIIVDVDV